MPLSSLAWTSLRKMSCHSSLMKSSNSRAAVSVYQREHSLDPRAVAVVWSTTGQRQARRVRKDPGDALDVRHRPPTLSQPPWRVDARHPNRLAARAPTAPRGEREREPHGPSSQQNGALHGSRDAGVRRGGARPPLGAAIVESETRPRPRRQNARAGRARHSDREADGMRRAPHHEGAATNPHERSTRDGRWS